MLDVSCCVLKNKMNIKPKCLNNSLTKNAVVTPQQ